MKKENNKTIQFILDSIEQGNISAESGFRIIKSLEAGEAVVSTENIDTIANHTVYFSKCMEAKPISTKSRTESQEGAILLFSDNNEIINAFKRTQGNTKKFVFISPGYEFIKCSENEYSMDPSNLKHYTLLLDETVRNNHIEIINFKCSMTADYSGINASTDAYLYNLFLMTKAIFEKSMLKKVHMINVLINGNKNEEPIFAACGSFAKSAVMENSKLMVKTVELMNMGEDFCSYPEIFADIVLKELTTSWDRCEELIYINGIRYRKEYKEGCEELLQVGRPVNIKKNGVYLITGGMGSIGKTMATHIAGKECVKLILCGRSEKRGNDIDFFINEIKSTGSEAIYINADVSVKEDVVNLVNEVHKAYGRIDGVIHCAGVLKDSLIINKEPEDFKAVLAPKISGTINLDLATREDKPDFFILFSSLVAVMGNIGQSDYSAANKFMDEYVRIMENVACEEGVNRLYSSINWPLWVDGTMGIKEEEISFLQQAGLKAMPGNIATDVFDNVLKKGCKRLILGYGNTSAIKGAIINNKITDESDINLDKECEQELIERTESLLKDMFSELFKIPKHNIEPDIEFREYGMDSILVRNFNKKMEQTLGNISKTLLYEHDNIHELSRYLVLHNKSELLEILRLMDGKDFIEVQTKIIKEKDRMFPVHNRGDFVKSQGEDDIAIIGVSGRYPMAENIEELWNNLKNGRDCISEIPAQRWDADSYYHPDADMAGKGKMYCKWGAFLTEVDKFDPLFFNISPREAELMDPQERIFLETVWELMEESGYTSSRLRELSNGDKGSNVGVFVGVTTNTYQLWGPEEWAVGRAVIPNSLQWSLANRVSYLFNFRGPSMPVDTACSSSLTAVHLACESLKRKECKMAVVGGVNLYLHPSKYIYLCQMKMLSPSGKCHTFGEKGDGFVPGEGCGAILLKPLSEAVRDKDRILAVIKGTAVNHGGTTSGYTVPNPNAQAAVVKDAIDKAGISARSISYVEAHGTGTALGDPIEVSALTKVFEDYTVDRHFCSIGSVKTNIGHLESAAGIVGITKVILQLKHGVLVPSLHAVNPNPNIDFTNSPFFVQHDLKEWERPKLNENGETIIYPRRAGVSSFGAGGANAHIILEEYATSNVQLSQYDDGPQVIVLSARNEDRLREYALKISNYIENRKNKKSGEIAGLADIAFTLGQCREEMEERLGAVVSNVDDLMMLFKAYGSGVNNINGLCTGRVEKRGSAMHINKSINNNGAMTRKYSIEKLEDIVKQWCNDEKSNLRMLLGYRTGSLVRLPTYPFEKRRCWYNDSKLESTVSAIEREKDEKYAEMFDSGLNRKPFPGNGMSVMKPLAEKYTGNEVKYEVMENIAIVTMNDKENRNMFTTELHLGLLKAFMKIEQDPNIKGVIITGYDNVFCMGGTQEQLDNISSSLTDCSDTEFAYRGLLECKVPVIAAIQGHAMGGGLVLGLFADIVIMAKECVYSVNFTQYGFTPGVGATYIVKEKMGAALSSEMMFTAKSYTGNELKERGANFIFSDAKDVFNEALSLAKTLSKKPRETLEVLKTELAERTLRILPSIIRSEISMHRKVFSKIDAHQNIEKYFNTVFEETAPIEEMSQEAEGIKDKPEKEQKAIYQSFQDDRIDRVNKRNSVKLKNANSNKKGKAWGVTDIKKKVSEILCGILHVSENEVNTIKSFKDLGVDSISGVEIIRDLNKAFATNLDTVVIYDYSTVSSLAGLILQEIGVKDEILENYNPEKDVPKKDDHHILKALRDLKDKKIDIDKVEQLLEDVK
jgi:3-oxoacyl-(acyl-carrier-protein) synthase/enoyl-CoA hydratase/carnithine racemase/NADP-dependent 3-hydroxy acid dehydrogenase YdfG/acyl carrier protein